MRLGTRRARLLPVARNDMVDAPHTLSCCLGPESRHGSQVNPASDFYIQRPATSQVNLMLQFGWLLRSIPGSIAFAAIGAQTFSCT